MTTTTPVVPDAVPAVRVPLIGETASAFQAQTSQSPIDSPKDYQRKGVC
jgi:hypothetical protein